MRVYSVVVGHEREKARARERMISRENEDVRSLTKNCVLLLLEWVRLLLECVLLLLE
jgi:hypothetical protein